MLIAGIITVLVAGLIYLVTKPPAPKRCGSANGPPVTSPRIRLRDGRYLAYKTRGAAKEKAKYKIILTHGFCSSKDVYIPLSDDWLQELGICLTTFDRPGYAESDPNPARSPKNDAFDIQELADQLELGPKFYIIGLSMGSYPVFGCLKYLPHRVAGAALIGPVQNYWWPSFPTELCTKEFKKVALLEQWRLRLLHHAPRLAWLLRRWLPYATVDNMLKNNPEAFSDSDLVTVKNLLQMTAPDEHKVLQQGAYESIHRDMAINFGTWEFDPLMELSNPFPDDTSTIVHLWMGAEDRFVSPELMRHLSQRLPWMHCHEVPHHGHLLIHGKNTCEMIFRSLVLGELPSFESS